MILQKTNQYEHDYEIVDILASYTKMISDVKNIHYFIIRQLLDSIFDFYLFRPVRQWRFPGRAH